MAKPCEVIAYSFQQLIELFSVTSGAQICEVEAKLHSVYFQEYFNFIGAQTIVVEHEYVDHDYLEDYAEYYVRCFKDYRRKCRRLHFFKIAFSGAEFENCLLKNPDSITSDLLQENYLGFIVLKPLPRTIIGRTCLITYPTENRRYFPATRSYSANLFGLNLKVPNSLAFQEQDSVVAACATSALWSIFQATGQIFQHPIPSPSAITKNATEILTKDQRAFPSPGLTSIEMAHAIKSVGLEPYLVNAADHYLLKATLYSYLRAGIPMMFGFYLVDVSGALPSVIGKHAVAITGYSQGLTEASPFQGSGFKLRATRIDKIYVHDDQVGPFSRMVFDTQTIELPGEAAKDSILTSWRGDDGVIGGKRAISDILLIPVYHKIRIPFGRIHDLIYEFDYLLKNLVSSIFPDDVENSRQLEWDIYLISVNDLKADIRHLDHLTDQIRTDVLFKSFPRFLWRASLFSESNLLLDLIFDATDLEQGAFFIQAVEYDSQLSETLRTLCGLEGIENYCRQSQAWAVFDWFRSNAGTPSAT